TSHSFPSPGIVYAYRADGLRHSGSIVYTSTTTTTYVWNGSHPVLSGADIFHRTPDGRLIRSQQNGWYLYNARGDVVQRTDNNRNVLHSYRYSAFGIELTTAHSSNRFRFAGEYWCPNTRLYYLRARNYNPRAGRFPAVVKYYRQVCA
ncbi:MAG: hypothetical protein FWE27_04985, partial [Defluviitaleaceae bacterium]|nr:hypothetical protein [Defluviitaleaceae bacterium]